MYTEWITFRQANSWKKVTDINIAEQDKFSQKYLSIGGLFVRLCQTPILRVTLGAVEG
jgi:hypothetical protein